MLCWRLKNLFLKKYLYCIHYLDFVKETEARIIFKYLDLKKGDVICDIGCGTGEQSIRMAKKGCKVCGIDISQASIGTARMLAEGYDCHFIEGNSEELPYDSGVFDKVVSVCAMEHFYNDEAVLREINRILKPGGILVLTVDSFTYKGISDRARQSHRDDYHVVNFYTSPQLEEKLVGTGFKVIQSRYLINSPLSAFFFRQRLKYQRVRFGLALITTLFPLTYFLSIISDMSWGRSNEGYLLAIKAIKES